MDKIKYLIRVLMFRMTLEEQHRRDLAKAKLDRYLAAKSLEEWQFHIQFLNARIARLSKTKGRDVVV